MHIKIKNKRAVIEFESGLEKVAHIVIIDELVHLVQNHFKDFVFDFKSLEMSLNSTIAGFLLGAVKKLTENGATVTLQNLSENDLNILKMIGIEQISDKITYIMRS
jgi:anti-anti-sigma regulatory factor